MLSGRLLLAFFVVGGLRVSAYPLLLSFFMGDEANDIPPYSLWAESCSRTQVKSRHPGHFSKKMRADTSGESSRAKRAREAPADDPAMTEELGQRTGSSFDLWVRR